MPRLPDVNDFGSRPSIRTGSPLRVPGSMHGDTIANAGAELKDIGKLILQEKNRDDTLKAEDAYTQLQQKGLDLSLGDDGYANLHGSDAVNGDIIKKYGEKYDTYIGELEGDLDPNQKRLFRQRAEIGKAQFREGILSHVIKEKDTYAKQVYEGGIDVEIQNASTNWSSPTAMLTSKARIAGLVNAEAERNGWSPEVTAAERTSQFSKLHKTIIQNLAEYQSPATAWNYFEQHKDEIEPDIQNTLISNIDTSSRQAEAMSEKLLKRQGDAALKDAFDKQFKGTLTYNDVLAAKPFVSPPEYNALLKSIKGDADADDPAVFGELTRLAYTDPNEAERQAFLAHSNRRITNSTLASILSTSRSISRSEGPKSVYERSRAFISDSLAPSPLVPDAAAQARYGIAIKEFDDYAAGDKRSDDELSKKANEVIYKYAQVDMNDLAKKSGLGAQNSPDEILKRLIIRRDNLNEKLKSGDITKQEYDNQMADLIRAKEAAEKAKSYE